GSNFLSGIIKGLEILHIDGCTNGVAGHGDIRRFHYGNTADKVRTYRTEVDRASTGGCGNAAAVKQGFVEVPTKAAHRNARRFTARTGTLNGNTRHPLQRSRDVGVRKLTDILSGNGVNNT